MSAFFDLEELVCDAANMSDLLNFLIKSHFSKSGDDSIVITSIEANRLFFAASVLLEMTDKVKDAYYVAWDKNVAERRCAGKIAAPEVDGGAIFEPKKLQLDGLFSLYDALGTIHEVVTALTCQPKFNGQSDSDPLPPAGDMLQKLCEFIAEAQSSVLDEGCRREPANDRERQRKFFFLAGRVVDGRTDPAYAMTELTKSAAALAEVRL